MQNEFIYFLKQKLNEVLDFKELAKKVGYKNLELGEKRISKVKDMDFLGLNTQDRYYFDGEFGARQIINNLLIVFNASDKLVANTNSEIDAILLHKREQKQNRLTIKIQTEIKPSKTLWHLAYRLNITLAARFNSLPYDAKIKRVSQIIKAHYKQTQSVKSFGNITGYALCFKKDGKLIYFDIDGELSQGFSV